MHSCAFRQHRKRCTGARSPVSGHHEVGHLPEPQCFPATSPAATRCLGSPRVRCDLPGRAAIKWKVEILLNHSGSISQGKWPTSLCLMSLAGRRYFGEHAQHKPVREEVHNILRSRVTATNSLTPTGCGCDILIRRVLTGFDQRKHSMFNNKMRKTM